MHGQHRGGSAGHRARDPFDERRAAARSAALNGAASAGAIWATATASIPSHITGAIAAAASRFAGSAASETCSKWSAISGAVPAVAATVIAATSATGPGTARASTARSGGASASSATTAANDSCQPGSPADQRVERERDGGGEPERVPAVRRATGESRYEARGAHHSRTLDGRPGAGERDVDRHQGQREGEPQPQSEAGHRARREHERREQHHVLATDRE